jgi:hypothetical protein
VVGAKVAEKRQKTKNNVYFAVLFLIFSFVKADAI